MAFYHDLVTERSWEELQTLRKKLEFILIGGWAAYLYTKTLKSKDIDLICQFNELPKLPKHYPVTKNERLKKYEAVKGQVQIDIYLPHYSELGIPVHLLLATPETSRVSPSSIPIICLPLKSIRFRSGRARLKAARTSSIAWRWCGRACRI